MIKYLLICVASFTMSTAVFSQIAVDNTTTNVDQLIQDLLAGNGVVISNVQLNGGSSSATNEQIGKFTTSNNVIEMLSGLIMGSGDVKMAEQFNTGGGSTLGGSGNPATDADLLSLDVNGNGINDQCVLEFDFVPAGDTLKFSYIFASEEYEEYVCGTVNDAFGFFVSGPDPAGGSYSSKNVALVPDPANPSIFTSTFVSINTVNPGVAGSSGIASECASLDPNWASYNVFYQQNTTGQYEYDGRTVSLPVILPVVCGETYHLKLAIGDGGDSSFDSGVFIEEGSFASVPISISTDSELDDDGILFESCDYSYFVLSRANGDGSLDLTGTISGDAENGFDIAQIEEEYTFLPGETSDTIWIYPQYDGVDEGDELVIFTIEFEVCNEPYFVRDTLIIRDYKYPSIEIPDSLNICTELGEEAIINTTQFDGIGPYTYSWNTRESSKNIVLAPEKTTIYTLDMEDGCGHSYSDTLNLVVQCPIQAPNVFTPNNDGKNDFFSIKNLEGYYNPHLIVYNRYGKLVYESMNYQNDWDGTHFKNGNDLAEGVYYFVVTPNSIKYPYSETQSKEELKYTLNGYFTIFR